MTGSNPVEGTNPTALLSVADPPIQYFISLSLFHELDTLTGGGRIASSSRLRNIYLGTPERRWPAHVIQPFC
jgi:hypothetical protein